MPSIERGRLLTVLDRVPGLQQTRKLRRLVARVPEDLLEHAYREARAAEVDGLARDMPALFVSVLERYAAELDAARAACAGIGGEHRVSGTGAHG